MPAIKGNTDTSHLIDGTTQDFTFDSSLVNIDNRLLLVIPTWVESTLSASGISLDSITFNGVALTRLDTVASGVNNEIWYLLDPDLGSYNVSLAWGGPGIAEGGKATCITAVIVYGSVDRAAPLGALQKTTGVGTSAGLTIPAVDIASLIIDNLGVSQNVGFATLTVAGTNNSEQWNDNESGGALGAIKLSAAGSDSTTRVNGDISVSWTLSASRTWAYWAVEIRGAINGLLRAGAVGPF